MKIKIYADETYKNKLNHIVLLTPFWGNCDKTSELNQGRFDVYTQKGKEIFELSTKEDSEWFVLPIPYENIKNNSYVVGLSLEAVKYGKPLIIFYNHDSELPFPAYKNAIVFRTSINRNNRNPNEFSLPAWSIDYLKKYRDGKNHPRNKEKIPTIGYVGYVNYISKLELVFKDIFHPAKFYNSLKIYLKTGTWPDYHSTYTKLRGRIIRMLLKSKRLNFNFIRRKGFFFAQKNANIQKQKQFVENILNSDYLIAVRGEGNFSYRLYEILCCGRIPIIINTQSVFPFEKFLEWKKMGIWIEEDEVDTLEENILSFHNNITEPEFIALQNKLRDIYLKWISPVGFHTNIHKIINDIHFSH